LRRVRALCP